MKQFEEEMLLHSSVVFEFLYSSLLFCWLSLPFSDFFWRGVFLGVFCFVFLNLCFHYHLEEQLPWENEGSRVVVQDDKPSEQERDTPREAVLRALQPLGSCQAGRIPTAFKHTQLADSLIKNGKRKVDMYERNWKEKRRLCFPLSLLILFQPALHGIQTISK